MLIAARQMFYIGGKRLPRYLFAEYLDSDFVGTANTGGQHIYGGPAFSDLPDCVLELDMRVLSPSGNTPGNNTNRPFFGVLLSSTVRMAMYCGSSALYAQLGTTNNTNFRATLASKAAAVFERRVVKWDFVNDQFVNNGTALTGRGPATMFDEGLTAAQKSNGTWVRIFGLNSGWNNCKARFYRYRCWRGGALVQDVVPAVDRETNEALALNIAANPAGVRRNLGGGAFTAGPLTGGGIDA